MILHLFDLVSLHSNVQVKSKHTICKYVNEVLLLTRKTFLGAREKIIHSYLDRLIGTKISESLFMYLIKNSVMVYVYVINRQTFV